MICHEDPVEQTVPSIKDLQVGSEGTLASLNVASMALVGLALAKNRLHS